MMQLESAYPPVTDPTIDFVIDQTTGQESQAASLLPSTAEGISLARMKAYDDQKHGRPSIVCAACHARVYPKFAPNKSGVTYSHFANEGKGCEYSKPQSVRDLSIIDAMRYNGQKESDDHIRLKNILRESILADTKNFTEPPLVEKNWYGCKDKTKWRRPDVSAFYGNKDTKLRIAFEVQLSSTYLHVISARRKFYLEENALLFWIFNEASTVDPRQYQNDLFYNNNSNLFIVDSETCEVSKRNNKFHLRCYYLKPTIVDENLVEIWAQEMVSFDDLVIDLENQRVYYFDTAGEKAALLAKNDEQRKEKERRKLVCSYELAWVRCHQYGLDAVEHEFESLAIKLNKYGVKLPDWKKKSHARFAALVLSARDGVAKCIGNSNFTLLQIANNADENYKNLFYYFYKVMSHHKRWDELYRLSDLADSRKHKRGRVGWRERKSIIYNKIINGDSHYIRDADYIEIFKFMFPDIHVIQ